MERVTSRGVTGSKAKFVIDLPKHSLSFATKIQEDFDNLETNLPSEASIDLPKVHVSAEYIQVRKKSVLVFCIYHINFLNWSLEMVS